jgi:pyruvate formate lyase activating enzyme
VIFFPGCNLRCPWCHNRELVLDAGETSHGSGADGGSGGFKTNAPKPKGSGDSGGFKANAPKSGGDRGGNDTGDVRGFKANVFKPAGNGRGGGGFKTNTPKPKGSGDSGGFKANAGYITIDDALSRIEKRRNVLGGVVLSGGEPTLFPDLDKLIARLKSIGLKVKLDTNGMLPGVLEKLFADPAARPDYLAMDFKLAPERYTALLPGAAGNSSPGEALKRSAALIRASGIPHEFRSLSLPEGYFGPADRLALAPLAGDSTWYIRPFTPGNCLDPAWNEKQTGISPMAGEVQHHDTRDEVLNEPPPPKGGFLGIL